MISPGRTLGPALFAASNIFATIIGSVELVRGQTQIIPLHSGSGQIDGPDTAVHVLIDGSSADQAAARMAPFAVVYEPQYDVLNLPTDPSARWIGPAPGQTGGGRTVLYAVPFTVNTGPIVSADLQCVAKGEDLAGGTLFAALLLNGQLIGEIPLHASVDSGAGLVVDDIAPLLSGGINWLQFRMPFTDMGSGLIFSGRVRIWGSTNAPELVYPILSDETGSLAVEFAVAEAVSGCAGFTCRPRGDLDSDRDMDLADYLRFTECLSGATTAPPDGCEYADFDCDGDVDLGDVSFFQDVFTGSW